MWPVQQGGGFMDVEPVDHFHGHHPQFMEQMPTVQLHSMDIQPSAPVMPEHRMEIVNQPPPYMQPQPTFTNRHPLSFHVAQTGPQQVPQQVPQQILQQLPVQPLPQQPMMASPVSSPDTPKKKRRTRRDPSLLRILQREEADTHAFFTGKSTRGVPPIAQRGNQNL